jgi:hypothetical protein
MEDLPMFLKVSDLQRLLQVSTGEAYVIAHTIGVTRVGKRLIRIPREAFLRWRGQRLAEAEATRSSMRQAWRGEGDRMN